PPLPAHRRASAIEALLEPAALDGALEHWIKAAFADRDPSTQLEWIHLQAVGGDVNGLLEGKRRLGPTITSKSTRDRGGCVRGNAVEADVGAWIQSKEMRGCRAHHVRSLRGIRAGVGNHAGLERCRSTVLREAHGQRDHHRVTTGIVEEHLLARKVESNWSS